MAQWILHIECSNLYYRRYFELQNGKAEVRIPLTELRYAVELNLLLIATRNIYEYTNEDFNDDYSDLSFDLDKGSFLAIEPLEKLFLTTNYLAGGRNNYPMIMFPSETQKQISYYITENGKIGVRVPIDLFTEYRIHAKNPIRKQLLQMMILQPVLVSVLSKCAYNREFLHEQENSFWLTQVQEFLEENGLDFELMLDDENGVMRMVQILLDQPLAYQFTLFDQLNTAQDEDDEE